MSLTWATTHKDSSWHGMPNIGNTQLLLAHPGLDVAKDQLPSPWSLGAPAGKDICQRESWQLYFLFHLGLSLIHTSCFFPFSSLCLHFLPFSSHSTPPSYLTLYCPSLDISFLSLFILYSYLPFPSSLRMIFMSSSPSVLPLTYMAPQPLSSVFPFVPSLYVGVDNILALHMTVSANWATAWRSAGGK